MSSSLTPERWQQVMALFDEIVDLEPTARAARLAEVAAADPQLHREVLAFLNAFEEADRHLNAVDEVVGALPQPARLEVKPGSTVGHYEVLAKLGGGGMGIVYRARDLNLERTVALKFLPPHLSTDATTRTRFTQEAKAASALDHVNLCTIHEIGTADDGQLFIAMAYYSGKTLKAHLAEAPLDEDTTLDYAIQTARGLAKAHAAGILHRDIKPANVMVTDEGIVKVLDFGLAKQEDVQLTRTGVMMGTVAYMSPEQVRGEPVDGSTDVWSLGVMMYELLTGQRPFEALHPPAIMYAVLHGEPLPLTSAEYPVVSPEMAAIVHRCLQKDRAQRYASIGELLTDLAGLHAQRHSTTLVVPAAARPARPRTWALAGLAVLLVAAAGYWLRPAPDPGALHLAVLPFTYQGDTADDKRFCDGLTELLSIQVQFLEPFQSPQNWVVSAREVLNRNITSPDEARRVLGANRTISGICQRSAGRVRLYLSLDDAEQLGVITSSELVASATDRLVFQDSLISRLRLLLDGYIDPDARPVAIAGGTDNPDAFAAYVQGRAYLQQLHVDVEAAIERLTAATQADTAYAQAFASLCQAYRVKYDTHTRNVAWLVAARRNCERALTLNPNEVEAHISLAIIHRSTGDPAAAQAALEQALTIDPNNARAMRSLGRLHHEQGRVDVAEQTYRQALALQPDYWLAYNSLGRFYLNQGRYADAAGQFQRVIDLAPDNYLGYNGLGASYYSMNQLEQARDTWKQALAIRPSYQLHQNLGALYSLLGDTDEAIRSYEQALALNDSDYRVWAGLASLYASRPDDQATRDSLYRRAIQIAENTLVVAPGDVVAQASIAEYALVLSDTVRTRQFLQALRPRIVSQRIDLTYRAIWMYGQVNDWDEAEALLDEALQVAPPPRWIQEATDLAPLLASPTYQTWQQSISSDSTVSANPDA